MPCFCSHPQCIVRLIHLWRFVFLAWHCFTSLQSPAFGVGGGGLLNHSRYCCFPNVAIALPGLGLPSYRPSFNSIITCIKRVLDQYVEQGLANISDEHWLKLGGLPNQYRADGRKDSPKLPSKSQHLNVPAKTALPSSLSVPQNGAVQITTPVASPKRPSKKPLSGKNPFAKPANYVKKSALGSPNATAPVSKGPDYIKMGLAEELGLIGIADYVQAKGRKPSLDSSAMPKRSQVLSALQSRIGDSSSEEESSDASSSEGSSSSSGSSSEDGDSDEQDEEDRNTVWQEVDFTPGLRSRATTWYSPTGDFQWEIQGAHVLESDPDSEDDPLSQRIQLVVDHVLKIKECHAAGKDVLPSQELDLILMLGQDYHGVLDEIRNLLEKKARSAATSDVAYTRRVREATQKLATLFQLILESMAEVTSNFGMGDDKQLKEEVESCCRKFAIACMTLSNVVERGNKSFARFRKQPARKQAAQPRHMQYAMRELPV